MRADSVIASIGITETLVVVGSMLIDLETKRRHIKRQFVENRLY